ncbi:7341_t:CDS:2 [Ambispora gerdemannii]|uniref:7341_t:CDS:1 n=1 Tax=Ambispora gerdemannii TaxID=144530 RepID=A0A9N8YVT3_9GLOM|nr:7341_t:CDS:2 [Ambispora gerdemannii]
MTKITEVTPLELKGDAKKSTLIAARPVITVREALKMLATHNITSLPIYSHTSNKIVNIVNLSDILNYIIKEAVADEKHPIAMNSEKVINLDNTIEAVMTLDVDRESYRIYVSDAHEGLKKTLEAFSKGIHHSLVIDYTEKTPPYILTQTDIVRYIHSHPESVPGISFDASLQSLGLGLRDHEVVAGYVNESALNVYRRMAEKNLMGIPILDSDDNLILSLSVSDLRGMNYQSIDNLILPVREFLTTIPNNENVFHPITATRQSTLREVLDLIVKNHIHRIWIVDESRKILDVLTLSDIIGFLTKL